MPRVGFMTYGELHGGPEHPRIQEFIERSAEAFAQAEGADGHITTANGQDDAVWGARRTPEFPEDPTPSEDRHQAQTLTLWRDLESVAAFAYSGTHLAALRKRKDWFRKIAAPVYVAWWVADDHVPSWDEACGRLEHLHAHGPTPHAFTFARAFGPNGEPLEIARPRR